MAPKPKCGNMRCSDKSWIKLTQPCYIHTNICVPLIRYVDEKYGPKITLFCRLFPYLSASRPPGLSIVKVSICPHPSRNTTFYYLLHKICTFSEDTTNREGTIYNKYCTIPEIDAFVKQIVSSLTIGGTHLLTVQGRCHSQ